MLSKTATNPATKTRAKAKAAAAAPTIRFADLPALGAPLDAGVYWGVATLASGSVCAVVLLPDEPNKRLTWKAAIAWAKKLNAELPTRPVSALLFAVARALFAEDWYWCAEEHERDGSYAWIQYFDDGDQFYHRKSYEGRARAVRLIPVVA